MSRDPDMDLFLAVAADDVAGVEAALRGEGYANEIEAASKMAPMSWAARLGRLDCARAMMAAGGDPWAVATGAEASAMAYARIHGQWELYEAMSKEGDPKLALPGAVEAEWVAAVGASCARALPALAPLGIEVDKAFGNWRQPPAVRGDACQGRGDGARAAGIGRRPQCRLWQGWEQGVRGPARR